MEELLGDWARAEWRPKRRARGTPISNGNYHPTAIERKVVSAPLRAFLAQAQTRPNRILYYGMGKHEVGLAALRVRGAAFGYDSHHPKPSRRRFPGGLFDEIHCHYVLNIVDSIDAQAILAEIYSILTSDGMVIISVRRDL